jgi:predicted transcriptional regulator
MAKEPPIGVRLESDVRAALEKLAKQEDRSISYLISKIVTDYLRAKKLIK